MITERYLEENPNHIFVFGDNLLRKGTGGAAALRHCPNTYGFVTKKSPTHFDEDYYNPNNYIERYLEEIYCLRDVCKSNPEKIYLISKLGAGLANKYKIFEKIIEPSIKSLLIGLPNVRFLW